MSIHHDKKSSNKKQRVVVTGIGVVTPLGNHLPEFANNLLAGKSGATTINVFDPASLPCKIAAQVRDVTEIKGISDRKVLFALQAARSAVHDAAMPALKNGRLCIGIGLELFSMPDMVEHIAYEKSLDGTNNGISNNTNMNIAHSNKRPLTYLQTPSDICVHMIAHEHQLTLPPHIHISACAASTDAIGSAFHTIQSGESEWALAGGTDSMINPLGLGGFCKLNALTNRNDQPAQASRPFDKSRDGFLLGEGAAFLVMESYEAANARGAKIYGEMVGYGNSFDAHGISEPHPQGDGACSAMQRAIDDAGINTHDIGYINAHGTSTPKNDNIETLAIKRTLGAQADKVKVSSTKSMLGHLISAAGAVETAAMLVCAQQGYIHGTINLNYPDPECDLDYVSQGKEPLPTGYMLKNSFGFGGQNACLVLRVERENKS